MQLQAETWILAVMTEMKQNCSLSQEGKATGKQGKTNDDSCKDSAITYLPKISTKYL